MICINNLMPLALGGVLASLVGGECSGFRPVESILNNLTKYFPIIEDKYFNRDDSHQVLMRESIKVTKSLNLGNSSDTPPSSYKHQPS